MFALSLLVHLGLSSLIFWTMSSPQFHPVEEQVTYVDMVTPPVASPQAGTPSPARIPPRKTPVAPLPVPAPVAPAPVRLQAAAMPLPVAKPQPKPISEKPKLEQPAPVEDGREFDEQLARIQQRAEDKRQAAVLDRLRKGSLKVVGTPKGEGGQAGSDYSSYIQSRLKDAFRQMIASRTRAPQVLVRVSIGIDGRISNFRLEKTSGDSVFDLAVSRAVTFAGRSFKPPPGGLPFERVFRFRPEGVGVS
jgi:colicin import membrane protein